jgi:tripartite-type tricarboxylate transporter receptor subunit TctC
MIKGCGMRLLHAVLGCVLGMLISAAAPAAYPDKPIRLIIPFSPGASADNYARIAGGRLSERVGQPVVVEARVGANGIIATEYVAKSPPDGYTLLLANSALTLNQALYRKLPFQMERDFVTIAAVAFPSSMVLVAHPSLPARNLQELLDLARAKPDQITYGSAGIGNILHISGATLNAMAGVKLLHVPYKGAAPALNDLLAGQVHLMFNAVGLLTPHIRAGRLRPLAVASARRTPELPDVPTIHEAGVPGYNVTSWFGILAPAATPREVVERLRAETVQGLNHPEAHQRLAQHGADPPNMTPAEFAQFYRDDIVRAAKIVKDIGLSMDRPE